MEPLGSCRWIIPEGFIPDGSMANADRALESHEAACVLNTGDEDASLEVTIYFSDREPAGPYRASVPARRTRHLRFSELEGGEEMPKGTDYASVIESSVPVVVQHTRLDSRAAELSLMTTMAYPVT